MTIEEEVFKKYKVNFNKLESYGFKKENNYYIYSCFIDDDFKAIIKIDLNGLVSGNVYDVNTNLEYSNIRLKNPLAFALKIKEKYENILRDIANNCFSSKPFIFDQTNRIAKYIKEKYDVNPEFLWEKTPDCGVFRNKNNKKWFGIVMSIDKSKLGLSEGLADVMNVKVDNLVDDLVNNKSIFKAYHMNKKSWITIILDDSLKDDEIIKYIDISYNLVKGSDKNE